MHSATLIYITACFLVNLHAQHFQMHQVIILRKVLEHPQPSQTTLLEREHAVPESANLRSWTERKLSVFELSELFYLFTTSFYTDECIKAFYYFQSYRKKEFLNVCFSLKIVSLQIPKLKDDTALLWCYEIAWFQWPYMLQVYSVFLPFTEQYLWYITKKYECFLSTSWQRLTL